MEQIQVMIQYAIGGLTLTQALWTLGLAAAVVAFVWPVRH
jgi:hypothetical protein